MKNVKLNLQTYNICHPLQRNSADLKCWEISYIFPAYCTLES